MERKTQIAWLVGFLFLVALLNFVNASESSTYVNFTIALNDSQNGSIFNDSIKNLTIVGVPSTPRCSVGKPTYSR